MKHEGALIRLQNPPANRLHDPNFPHQQQHALEDVQAHAMGQLLQRATEAAQTKPVRAIERALRAARRRF